MISREALRNYQGRALALCCYGNGGLEKTFAARLLPPPTLVLDYEGGTGPLGPWTRRVRRYDEGSWLEYTDGDRNRLFELVPQEKRKARAVIHPGPYVDIVSFDPMAVSDNNALAYEESFRLITNLPKQYNSLVLDPLAEFSQATQTKSKVVKNVSALEPMHVRLWGGAQERAAILLRVARSYRDSGIFIYMTSGEFVDKDYGDKDPREQSEGGQKEEPYAIKGTFNVPGQLVNKVNHMLDVQCHARMMSGQPVWVTKEEPARSGSFNWEAKDRTGRIQGSGAYGYIKPNIRTIIKQVYGQEAYEAIYSSKPESEQESPEEATIAS